MTQSIPGPIASIEPVRHAPPPGACDCHAHIFGPADRFPYAEGRGYTPPDAPIDAYLALLDGLGLARGVVVQGNAHGYDNRVILDALARAPERLRGIVITDRRTERAELARWAALGVRGLRFHVFHPERQPGYVRGVGLDVLDHFRPAMLDLGLHAQIWCDWRMLEELEPALRRLGAEMPVVIDHLGEFDASLGASHPAFGVLHRLVADGCCWAKLSGAYRCSALYPDYGDVAPLHEALVRANPDRLVWGSDWPHPSIPAAVMPNDGHLLNLLGAWVGEADRRRILVDNPAALYGFPKAR